MGWKQVKYIGYQQPSNLLTFAEGWASLLQVCHNDGTTHILLPFLDFADSSGDIASAAVPLNMPQYWSGDYSGSPNTQPCMDKTAQEVNTYALTNWSEEIRIGVSVGGELANWRHKAGVVYFSDWVRVVSGADTTTDKTVYRPLIETIAESVATILKTWCSTYSITYIDIDVEKLLNPTAGSDDEAALRTNAVESEFVVIFLVHLSKKLKEAPDALEVVSHAPEASNYAPMIPLSMYFDPIAGTGFRSGNRVGWWSMYRRIEYELSATGDIDFYNIQYYNQQETSGGNTFSYVDADGCLFSKQGRAYWPVVKAAAAEGNAQVPCQGFPSVWSTGQAITEATSAGTQWMDKLRVGLGLLQFTPPFVPNPFDPSGPVTELVGTVHCTTLGKTISHPDEIWTHDANEFPIPYSKIVFGRPGFDAASPSSFIDLATTAGWIDDYTSETSEPTWRNEGGIMVWVFSASFACDPPIVTTGAGTVDDYNNIVSYFTALTCFMHGTSLIRLGRGTKEPTRVENLKVGDTLMCECFYNKTSGKVTKRGEGRAIKEVIKGRLTPKEYAELVRVVPKDAFGKGKPYKDLHVTCGHGLLLREMRDEWKNEKYDSSHVTYSKKDALVKGDFTKLLAGHCSLARRPSEEERTLAHEHPERMTYYHFLMEGADNTQYALVSNGLTSESLAARSGLRRRFK